MSSLLLQKTKIINVGPIKNIELIFNGPGVYTISGKNDVGKTTALQAIAILLQPFPRKGENPLKNGEKSGEVIAWLGDSGNGLEVQDNPTPEIHKYKLSRRFTPDSISKDKNNVDVLVKGVGSVVCEYVGNDFKGKIPPKDVLNSFIADLGSFDPWAFIKLDDKDQMAAALTVVKISLDRQKLAEIAGLDPERNAWIWPDSDLDCMDQLSNKLYVCRQETNRYLERAKAVFADIVIPEDRKDTKAVKLVELLAEKQILDEKKEINDAKHIKLIDLKVDKDDKLREFENCTKQQVTNIDTIDNQIAVLHKQINMLKEEKIIQINAGNVGRENLKKQIKNINSDIDFQQKTVDALIPVDYTEIDSRISKADETNVWAAKVEDKKIKEAEVDKLSKGSIDFTLKMQKITEYKRELLSQTKFPCEGMSFADGKVTMKNKDGIDIPLRSHGGKTQLFAAFEILRAQNPKLKVVLSFSETQIDEENTAVLDKLVKKYGFQFLRCQVAEVAEDGMFFIENGVMG